MYMARLQHFSKRLKRLSDLRCKNSGNQDCGFFLSAEDEPTQRDTSRPEDLEEKILDLPLFLSSNLEVQDSALTVLRRSDVEYRIVTTSIQAEKPLSRSEDSLSFNVGYERLIPTYATAVENFGASNSVDLCNAQGQCLRGYNFGSLSDVFRLQQALTGYRVHHAMSDISWRINSGDTGTGSLQLWYHKPMRNDGTTSHINGLRRDGMEPVCTEVPALLLFTRIEGNYAFLHVSRTSICSTLITNADTNDSRSLYLCESHFMCLQEPTESLQKHCPREQKAKFPSAKARRLPR